MNVSTVQNVWNSVGQSLQYNLRATLTPLQKKVAWIALAILSSLAIGVVFYKWVFDGLKSDSKDENSLLNKLRNLFSWKPKENTKNESIEENIQINTERESKDIHVSPTTKTGQSPSPFDATIPVIDMSDFKDKDPVRRQKFVDGLKKAFIEVGFVAVLNPGVNQTVLDEGYQASEKFFRLSREEKMKVNDPTTGGQRGYCPGETAKGQKTGDCKEFYHIGRELTESQANRLNYNPNIWPDGMDLKTPMNALFQGLEEHIVPLQQAIAQAIGMPEDFFTNMTGEGNSLLRAIYYPSNPPEDQQWAAPHTDIDLFTILPRATAEGLQVQNERGEWIDVKVPKNAFIINAGDMLKNITNGLFKSGLHRVVSNKENEERFSMVYFIHPRCDDRLDPLTSCIEETGGFKLYPEASRDELLFERLIDLGLASDGMKENLAKSGLVERLIDLGRASPKVVEALVATGYASQKVQQEWDRL